MSTRIGRQTSSRQNRRPALLWIAERIAWWMCRGNPGILFPGSRWPRRRALNPCGLQGESPEPLTRRECSPEHGCR